MAGRGVGRGRGTAGRRRGPVVRSGLSGAWPGGVRARAERVSLAKGPASGELGYAGLPSFGGIASSEVDPILAWKLPNRWDTIRSMDGDPDVLAVFRAMALPILAVPLLVEPASDRPEARAMAEFIERDLNNMTIALARHRAQTLKAPRWGNRIFETVFTRGEDGLYHLRKLALRPSGTISIWHLDDNGGPDGVTQVLGDGRTVRLGMDRILGFVFGESDLGLVGEPLTRAMYGPWLLKTRLAQVGAAAAERHGMGLPTLRYTGNVADNRDRYESMLMGIHAHQKAFMLLGEGVDSMDDFEIKGITGSVLDPLAQMEYHRRACYVVGMAQHMLLGAESSGSYALSADQSSNFLMAEQALMADLEDTYNRYLLPRWVGYNWPAVAADDMPRFRHGTLARKDVKAWFESLTLAVAAGVSLDSGAVNDMARDLLGIVQPDDTGEDEDIAPVQDVNAPDEVASDDAAAPAPDEKLARKLWPVAKAGAVGLADGRPSLKILEDAGIVVRFVELAARMDRRAAELDDKIGPLQKKQAKRVGVAVGKLIKAGDPDALAEWLADPRNIPSDEESDAIETVLRECYEDGWRDAWGELAQQRIQPEPIDDESKDRDRSLLALLALMAGRELASRMGGRVGYEAFGQLNAGKLDAGRLLGAALGDALLGEGRKPSERRFSDLALRVTNKSLGMGRGTLLARAEAAGLLVGAVWSTMLDPSVCVYGEGDCASLEGVIFDTMADAPPIPNPGCLGADRCRCILVPMANPDRRLPVPEGADAPQIEPMDDIEW